MSQRAGTIQGTVQGTSWTGGWVAALLLTALIAVALFAVNRSGGAVDRAPVKAGMTISGQQLSGGTNYRAAPTTLPAQAPIVINGNVCHQCR